jgi:hypothetical protein
LSALSSHAHLAGLRKDGVSYIFAGERAVALGRALDILNRELGIQRLEVNGGGLTNGAFLDQADHHSASGRGMRSQVESSVLESANLFKFPRHNAVTTMSRQTLERTLRSQGQRREQQ